MFDKVQNALNENYIPKTESKEFAFTKLIKCGFCGSGITADEKFKKQKNGNVHRYVYYGCTKFKDKHCKSGYINEEELIEQFTGLMDEISLDEIGIKEKLKAEVERIKKFQRVIIGTREKIEVADVDIRNYAKYILKEANDVEKRELLSCIKSRITLVNKIVSI